MILVPSQNSYFGTRSSTPVEDCLSAVYRGTAVGQCRCIDSIVTYYSMVTDGSVVAHRSSVYHVGGSDYRRVVLALGSQHRSSRIAGILMSSSHIQGTGLADMRHVVVDSSFRTVGALSQFVDVVGLRGGTDTDESRVDADRGIVLVDHQS